MAGGRAGGRRRHGDAHPRQRREPRADPRIQRLQLCRRGGRALAHAEACRAYTSFATAHTHSTGWPGSAVREPVETLRVLYAGTLGRAQGLSTVVTAASLAARAGTPVHVRVVGAGAEEQVLRALARRLDAPVDVCGAAFRARRALRMGRCDREGPNVGFPPLTHGRIAVRNWAQNTSPTLPSQLAVVLVPPLMFWGKPGERVRPIRD